MLFPTVEFAAFFALIFGLSWSVAAWPTLRKWVLVVASFFFYGWWDFRFVALLFNCTVVNYMFGIWIDRAASERLRKAILITAVTANLGVLAYFKYTGFFLATLSDVLAQFGLVGAIKVFEVVLPVGVSFYTFQGISYVVDIYRREMRAIDSPLDLLLFKSFFPQLVAGPIVRASEFVPQLSSEHTPTELRGTRALILIGVGLMKKVILASYLSTDLVSPVFSSPRDYGTIDMVLATYGYAIQIYCDFSAYTDMAIGFALLLGYEFPTNFNQPYRAESLQDFWRRWHISLSTFLRDYLYIPLGGSKHGTLKTYRNLMITMVLGGLWHGAAWNFVIWGVLHGAGLAVERFAGELLRRGQKPRPKYRANPLKIIMTFHFVCLTWIFFNAESFSSAIDFLASFGNTEPAAKMLTPLTLILLSVGMLTQFVPGNWLDSLEMKLQRVPLPIQATGLAAVVVMVTAFSPGALAPFIYFKF